MTWLLLEEMRVPYLIRTVPLHRYMLVGEKKNPDYIRQVGEDGVVPGVQFSKQGKFMPAMQSVEKIFAELERRYPKKFPRGDASIFAKACGREDSVFGRLRVARRAYEACAGAKGDDALALGLKDALIDLDAILARREGPFIGGCTLVVADLMLLPFLERTEAVVPYFFGEKLFASLPFSRAAAMLHAARSKKDFAFGAICSDATTLARTNLRYASAGAAPRYAVPSIAVDLESAAAIDGTATQTRDEWLAQASVVARRDAAARLAARPSEIVAFAVRSAGIEVAKDSPAALALEDALRSIACVLLNDQFSENWCLERVDGIRDMIKHVAIEFQAKHSNGAVEDAAQALEALSLNVGVPRDMDVEPARALRSHLRALAEALQNT